MMDSNKLTVLLIWIMVAASPFGVPASPAADDAFLGRWDITATSSRGGLPRFCWLELKRDRGTLTGRFNSGGGAVFDLPQVGIENGELKFQYPRGNHPSQTQQVWRATIENERLEGTTVVNGEKLSWSGVRGPVWPSSPPQRKPGKPIDLFNGHDVSGWLGQDPGRPLGWSVKDGILMNQDKSANNIYTDQKFNDFHLEVEFNVDPKSNSGVYLRGRYEIQILDGYGRPLDVHSQGALYGFIVPAVNADKPPGEWQTYEITLIANRLTVILNGAKIIDNGEVPGITGGALDADEKAPGPIMLQGDHGRVQFRRVRLTPLM
jgi:3-keto-disaccharide hydrolase